MKKGTVLESVTSALDYVLKLLFGIIICSFLTVSIVLSLPVLLYRWFIVNVCAPYFGDRNLKSPLDPGVNINLSADYLETDHPPRSSLTANLILDGHVTHEELYDRIARKWIRSRTENDGMLTYPELQQYPVNWMGFMFWKQETNFRLADHIKLHELEVGGGDKTSRQFMRELVENCLNLPWSPGKSPWEMHLVQNYRNSALQKGPLTLLTLRYHHCMGDGFSISHLLFEELFGQQFSERDRVRPARTHAGFWHKTYRSFILPLRLFQDMGNLGTMLMRPMTPLHILDSNKAWHQLYGQGPSIPTKKLKLIKNTFGVGFASVLDSAFAAVLGNLLSRKLAKGELVPRTLPSGIIVPKPNRPRGLRNFVTCSPYDTPIDPELDPVERLLITDHNRLQMKDSTIPWVWDILASVFGRYPTNAAEYILRNRYIATGISDFALPSVAISWDGRKLLLLDPAAGLLSGVAGIGGIAVSTVDHVSVTFIAEKAVLSREELEGVSRDLEMEVDKLFELALKKNG